MSDFALGPYARGGHDKEDDEDGMLVYDDEGGLALMVSKLAGVQGEPTMHRVELAWKERAVVPLLISDEAGDESSSITTTTTTATTTARSSFFTSHETAKLRGCGDGGVDGTAVVHRFRLADSVLPRTLASEAIRAAAETPGETVSNRNGSWHSAANVLLEDGDWPRDTADALGATLRDAIRLAWGAADQDLSLIHI